MRVDVRQPVAYRPSIPKDAWTAMDDLVRRLDNLSLRSREPIRESVLDGLATLLVDADELLRIVRAPEAADLGWTEPGLRSVYDDIDSMMRKLTN